MGPFDYYTGLVGLMLGLSITELLSRGAEAIHHRRTTPVGILSPMLAVAIVTSLASTWYLLWNVRDRINLDGSLVITTVMIASACYMGAALVFPKDFKTVDSLDEHYHSNKKIIAFLQLCSCIATQEYISIISHDKIRNLPLQFVICVGVMVFGWAILTFSKRSIKIDVIVIGLIIASFLYNLFTT